MESLSPFGGSFRLIYQDGGPVAHVQLFSPLMLLSLAALELMPFGIIAESRSSCPGFPMLWSGWGVAPRIICPQPFDSPGAR
jgi:hypothetical protein